MLRPHVTEIGVAVVRAPDRDPKFISVQLFGRPESLKVTFSIENRAGAAVRYKLGEETPPCRPRTIATYTRCEPDKLTLREGRTAAQAA